MTKTELKNYMEELLKDNTLEKHHKAFREVIRRVGQVYTVLTYGTLKECERNHRVMQQAGGEKIGEETISGYVMYDTPYGYPMAVKSNNESDNIKCEVYEVDSLEELNMLEGYYGEGHPHNLYNIDEVNGKLIYVINDPQRTIPSNSKVCVEWTGMLNRTNFEEEYKNRNKLYNI